MALANYLKEKGYLWNHHTKRYGEQVGEISNNTGEEQTAAPENCSQQDEMLQLLIKNRDKLAEIINGNGSESLPRYSLSGVRIAKTIHISNRLNELVKQFSEEKNINQREFMELAIIETMRKLWLQSCPLYPYRFGKRPQTVQKKKHDPEPMHV